MDNIPPSTTLRRLSPYLLLAAVELLAFGVFIPFLGFYHDDWANLLRLHGRGLWENMLYFTRVTPDRPLNILQYPILFSFGGLQPIRYHVFFILMETLEGWLLFALFERLFRTRALALLAATLILLFPTHAITHVWYSSAAGIVTINLTLLSLLLHLRWAEGGGWKELLLGQLLYALGALNYEIAAFLPALLVFGLAVRRRMEGCPSREILRRGFLETLPYPVSLALALFAGRAFVEGNPRAVASTTGHFFRCFTAGFECISNRVLHVCSVMAPLALEALTWKAAAAALLTAFATAWILRPSRPEAPHPPLRPTLAAAFAGILAAILPYALSRDYTPAVWGVMSRTTAVLSIPAGLLWAAGLYAWALRASSSRVPLLRAAPRVAAGLAAAGMLLADWGFGLQWVRSWELQKELVRRIDRRSPALPAGTTVIAADFPGSIEPGGAVVFGDHYDITGMIRLTTRRRDLLADVAVGKLRLTQEGIFLGPTFAESRRIPYGQAYLYRFGVDELWRIDGPLRVSEDPLRPRADGTLPFRGRLIPLE